MPVREVLGEKAGARSRSARGSARRGSGRPPRRRAVANGLPSSRTSPVTRQSSVEPGSARAAGGTCSSTSSAGTPGRRARSGERQWAVGRARRAPGDVRAARIDDRPRAPGKKSPGPGEVARVAAHRAPPTSSSEAPRADHAPSDLGGERVALVEVERQASRQSASRVAGRRREAQRARGAPSRAASARRR